MVKQNSSPNNCHKVHLLGICGISMSALALQLTDFGFEVSGSDRQLIEPIATRLTKRGIRLNEKKDLLLSETVVVSSAIPNDDKQLVFAKKSGKNIIERAELLSEISKCYNQFIGVGGTHGKTTTATLLAHVAYEAGLRFSAHLGGLDQKFGNYYGGGKQFFIAEVCEYKKNIARLSPDVSVLLNVDNDHLESYGGNFDSLRREFFDYLNRSKVAIFSDQTGFKKRKNDLCFSLNNPNCDYFARAVSENKNCHEYIVYEHIAPLFEVNLANFMPHDINNVLAVTASARAMGIDGEKILDGIKSFKGVDRRNQVLYEKGKLKVIADYAHHPKQIELAIRGYLSKFGNCVFLFQPHTYTRTRDLFNDFVNALSLAPSLYLFRTYGARESYLYEGSAYRLHSSLKNSIFAGDVKEVKSVVNGLIGGDLPIIVLGAGNIYDYLLDAIKGF